MIRHGLSLVIVALFMLASLPSHAEEMHFRDTRWGMKRNEVIEAEGREPDGDLGYALVYEGNVAGLDAIAFYLFTDGVLTEGVYAITERFVNVNNYAKEYDRLKRLLTEIYGKPKDEGEVWKSSLYRNRPHDERGRAASRGHLIMHSDWQTDNTTIQMTLGGENYEAKLFIYYKSLANQEEVEQQRREDLKQGL